MGQSYGSELWVRAVGQDYGSELWVRAVGGSLPTVVPVV